MTSNLLFCSIRKEWVADLPEEHIRQKFVLYMQNSLGYPASYISVEKELRHIPHLALVPDIPTRRADIVCFAKNIHPDYSLYPLLLVECKAVPLTKKVLNQVISYNHFLKAYFIAVVNDKDVKLGWFNKTKGKYEFIDQLPSYDELCKSVAK